MQISIVRENLLKALLAGVGVVERRQTKPILGNFLLQAEAGYLTVTGSDSEVESRTSVELTELKGEPFTITLPAQKLVEIVRSLPEGVVVNLDFEEGRCTVKAGRSSFKLSSLSGEDYPLINLDNIEASIELKQGELRELMQHCSFAMAHQDVRFYLNGMLVDLVADGLRLVATDGHRLSTCKIDADFSALTPQQVIMPRKGVVELVKLLDSADELITLSFANNFFTAKAKNKTFTCKLIDGRYPDYRRVIPQTNDVLVNINKETLKGILQRAAILSNERFKGIRMIFENNLLKVQAQNSEQDESYEDIAIDYSGATIEIGFNVNYLLDVINVVVDDELVFKLKDNTSSCLIQNQQDIKSCDHVIMPMRL